MRLNRWLAGLALALAAGAPALAQQAERTPKPLDEYPQGYLRGDEITYLAYLSAPPAEGSPEDELDVAAVKSLQASVSEARWRLADQDAKYLYPQFEAAFGSPIDREHAPHLVHLLNEALRDVELPTNAGKGYFARVRPYQRLQLARVCNEAIGPAPPPDPNDHSSYPSGHSAVGWTTALILAQVDPDHAAAVLARADDYALSRVICGAHFPSDTAASRMLAAAVVAREATVPAFQRDLACAKAEHAGKPSAACAAPAASHPPRRRSAAR
jgi:acid phosphatase (class A)